MGAAEVHAVPAPGTCGDALAGAHRPPRSRPVRPVGAGRAAVGGSVGAGGGESLPSVSGRAEGCKSPPLLDSLCNWSRPALMLPASARTAGFPKVYRRRCPPSFIQQIADLNSPLTRDQAQGLLTILDRLVDTGDRRAAALQL